MNPEHVRIVKQGKEAIDQWREANPDQRLDLSEADLAGTDLARASLNGSNLSGADMTGATLFQADLSHVDLSKSRLPFSDLVTTNLTDANLSEARLTFSDLSLTKLVRANLSNAVLRGCRLLSASLVGAELTGTQLWGTARDNWNIEGVKCRYVFWDREGKERSPRDRDLEPGEFERLYAQLPTIEYVFENEIMSPLDPLVMDRVVQTINEQNPEMHLAIDSINARGIYPTIKFSNCSTPPLVATHPIDRAG